MVGMVVQRDQSFAALNVGSFFLAVETTELDNNVQDIASLLPSRVIVAGLLESLSRLSRYLCFCSRECFLAVAGLT
jgi:hypothetical protein